MTELKRLKRDPAPARFAEAGGLGSLRPAAQASRLHCSVADRIRRSCDAHTQKRGIGQPVLVRRHAKRWRRQAFRGSAASRAPAMLFLRAVALSRSRLRIVFVLPVATLAGGIRTVAIYADYLRRQGHRVTVVSSPLARPTLREQVRSLRRGMGWLRAPRPPPSHLDAVEVDHRRIDRVRPIVDGDVPDADVVIATWWETAEWVAALSPS